ncbi:MAG: helix-turn-helix domain-containing protein [Oscillospiraceae bacterium]|nr:helix-turn-helix domain-containing protein [Oscillospiraceae bacterium]
MDFGNKLRRLIEERNITQKQLAIELNIAPSTVGGYVQNKSEPDFNILKALSKYFNVSADYLLDMRIGKAVTYKEDELLRVFRSLSEEQQNVCIKQCKILFLLNKK